MNEQCRWIKWKPFPSTLTVPPYWNADNFLDENAEEINRIAEESTTNFNDGRLDDWKDDMHRQGEK